MPRSLRVAFAGALYHITARGVRRLEIFRDDADRERFLAFLAAAVERFHWELLAFVLMDNHIHLFLRTPEPNISRGMQWLLSRYATWWSRRHDLAGHVFGGRFHTKLVEDDSHFWTVSRYVHRNPVRAGLVRRPEDWPWSSFPGYVRRKRRLPWVSYDAVFSAWRGEFGGTDPEQAYRRFVGGPQVAVEPSPFAAARRGWMLGGPAFIEKLDALAYLPLRLRRGQTPPATTPSAGPPDAGDVAAAILPEP